MKMADVAPELQQLALEMAVDSAWSFVVSESTHEQEGGEEWFALDEEHAPFLADELGLLEGLGLLGRHPDRQGWVREIAEL